MRIRFEALGRVLLAAGPRRIVTSILRMGKMGGGSQNGTPRTDHFPFRPDIRTISELQLPDQIPF